MKGKLVLLIKHQCQYRPNDSTGLEDDSTMLLTMELSVRGHGDCSSF